MICSAIVGCGNIASVHAAVLSASNYAILCACADVVLDRAERMSQTYHIPAYDNLTQMLINEKPDVLHICTPHYLHVPMAIEALKRGVHVFMEKPAAMDAGEFSDLVSACQNNSLYTGVCFQNRYNPQVCYVKAALESGEAGKILGARAFVTWARGEKYYTESGWRGQRALEGGGALMNQSIHTMDLLVHLLGRPKSVSASMHNRHLPGIIQVEDTVEAFIGFENAQALFYASTAYAVDAPVMVEIVCEKAVYTIAGDEVKVKSSGGTNVINMQPPEALGKSYWGGSHKLCIDDFYQAIATGRAFCLTPVDIAPTMALVYGAYQSAATGKPVLV